MTTYTIQKDEYFDPTRDRTVTGYHIWKHTRSGSGITACYPTMEEAKAAILRYEAEEKRAGLRRSEVAS